MTNIRTVPEAIGDSPGDRTAGSAAERGFAHRWRRLAAGRSPLCLGAAPSTAWLRAWNLPDEIGGAQRYCELVLDGAVAVAGFRVQTPFFLRFGQPGFELLRWFTDRAHEQGSAVLLDAKIVDAPDTMASYADLYLGPDSALGGDAVTACAHMGFESLEPLLDLSRAAGAAVFIMVRTSNHDADAVQRSVGPDGRTVAQALADAVTGWNARHEGTGVFSAAAAVLGARQPESDELAQRLPHAILEVPGLGRADRRTEEVLAPVADRLESCLLTVTTGVLREGPDPAALRASLARWRGEIGF
ncbi:MAG TPA: orotidine-5'-phosphate decarboxylase [Streptosporangiaceae bacterium]|nr:orotidine-5'-phosphate decarboxylase [Streptosporangiaceae bacterium]